MIILNSYLYTLIKFTNKMYIPSDVMPRIVSFLDPKDRAKMAMVNKAWNQFIYRDCLWGKDRWTYKPGIVGTVMHLPVGSRHIGSPYKACFFYWLQAKGLVLTGSISSQYRDWKRQGSPCLYIQHHRFEDTLIAASRYKELSSVNKLYIFHRFATYEIQEDTNRYRSFLQTLWQEFQYIQMHQPSLAFRGPLPSGTDLVSLFRSDSQRMIRAYQDELRTYIQHYMDRLQECIRALERRGTTSWILNDAAYAKDPMTVLDSIAFTF